MTMQDLLFKAEIERIGEKIGLKGKFIIDWGTDDIIDLVRRHQYDALITRLQYLQGLQLPTDPDKLKILVYAYEQVMPPF